MTKQCTFILTFSTLFFGLSAQVHFPQIDANSIEMMTGNSGIFFHDIQKNRGAYFLKTPNPKPNILIYSSSFWFGGVDSQGELKLAAKRHTGFGLDFAPGPFSSNNSYNNIDYIQRFRNSTWNVSREEIIYHIDNYNQPGYTAPASIKNWPANGDATLGVANDLAPFVDVDGDGVYNPMNGDYPCIRGDMASYVILNDDQFEHTASGGEKIGMEMHIMFYQFQSDNYIDSTAFINLRIINRGAHSFQEFKTSFWADMDIGLSGNDYAGTFPAKKLVYTYNDSNFDESTLAYVHTHDFKVNPPAFGMVSLNHDLASSVVFNGHGQVGSPPTFGNWTTTHYWNYMNGLFPNGMSFFDGGTGLPNDFNEPYPTTPFFFNGNPATGVGWSEHEENLISGNRVVLCTMEDVQFLPGMSQEYDFALIINRQGDYLENVSGLFDYADSVQLFYEDYLANYDCQQQGTGIPDTFEPPFDWTPWMVEVKRLDGRGNMGFSIDLVEESFADALWNNQSSELKYKANKSPVYVKIENPGAHALGRFELLFRDYGSHYNAIDTASWTIYRYDSNTNELLDFVESETTIEIGDFQYIPQWGISVQVKQQPVIFSPGTLPLPMNRSTTPIEVTTHFDTDTIGWLSGVPDIQGEHPQNWNLAGFDYYNSPNYSTCYANHNKDLEGHWRNQLNGTVAHFATLRTCAEMALLGSNENLDIQMAHSRNTIAQTPSVDLVFTHEKAKWTRCVVVEMCDDATISQGNSQKMKPRNRPSVDKNGYSAGHPDYNAVEGDLISPVGMGWFPGFAIDVETGRRLNVVFGENSFFANQNGSDMLWNPTSDMYDQVGNPRFGGQHVVFVIGENINNSGMPIYDSCATFFNNINSTNNTLNRDAWQSATWTMYPILREGHQLLEKPVLIRMRVNKRYEDHVITGINDGKPAFEWNISSVLPADLSTEHHDMPDALIYPNPTKTEFFIQFQNMNPEFVQVYSMTGVLVHEQKVSGGENVVKIETGNLANGVYVVQVGEVIRKVVVD